MDECDINWNNAFLFKNQSKIIDILNQLKSIILQYQRSYYIQIPIIYIIQIMPKVDQKLIKQLKNTIKQEKIDDQIIFYSLGAKDNSIMSSTIKLLVLNTIQGHLCYYKIEKLKNLPFVSKENLIQPKSKVKIQKVKYTRLNKELKFTSNEFENQYGKKKNQKGQWIWNFETKRLAQQWIKILDQSKQQSNKILAGTEQKIINPTGIRQKDNIVGQTNQISKIDNIQKQRTKIKKNDNQQNVEIKQSIKINRQTIHTNQQNEEIKKSKINKQIINNQVVIKQNQIGQANMKNKQSLKKQSKVSDYYYNSQLKIQSKINNQMTNIKKDGTQQDQIKKSQISEASNNFKDKNQQIKKQNKVNTFQSNMPINTLSLNVQSKKNRSDRLKSEPIQNLIIFRKKSQQLVKSIIDDLQNIKEKRKIKPQQQSYQLIKYNIQGLIIQLAFIHNQQKISQQRLLKNQFRNYNYIWNCTRNNGIFRVPMSSIVQYKGIICFVKLPLNQQEYKSIQPATVINELNDLQKKTGIKKEVFYNKKNGVLKRKIQKSREMNQEQNIIYIDELHGYLPYDPLARQECSQFKYTAIQVGENTYLGGTINKQHNIDKITKKSLDDLQTLSHDMSYQSQTLVQLIQSMKIIIVNPKQLRTQMDLYGVNTRCLSNMYKKAKIASIKKLILSEIFARIVKSLLRVQIQEWFRNIWKTTALKKQQNRNNDEQLLNQIYIFIHDILSNSQRSQKLWKIVINQTKIKYGLVAGKSEMNSGFFLSSLFNKSNLKLNYKYLNKQKEPCKGISFLRKQFIQDFDITTKCYDIKFTQKGQIIERILNNQKPDQKDYQTLQNLLQIKKRQQIPEFCKFYGLDIRIKHYLSNFIPYQSNKSGYLNIYDSMQIQPPTYASTDIALKAIKRCCKDDNQQQIQRIYSNQQKMIGYWCGQLYPTLFNIDKLIYKLKIKLNKFDQAITLFKKSAYYLSKIFGNNFEIIGQIYLDIANAYLMVENKQEALNYFIKSREIRLAIGKCQHQSYYSCNINIGKILLYYCKTSDSIQKFNQTLKFYQKNSQKWIKQNNLDQKNNINELNKLMEIYQLIQRAYEINNQQNEMVILVTTCSKIFNNIKNSELFERMIRLCLIPHIYGLSSPSNNQLKSLIKKFPFLKKQNRYDSVFQYLQNRAKKQNIITTLANKFKKIQKISNQIKQKDLFTRHQSLATGSKTDTQDFLVLFQAILYIVGEQYIQGLLNQSKYREVI